MTQSLQPNAIDPAVSYLGIIFFKTFSLLVFFIIYQMVQKWQEWKRWEAWQQQFQQWQQQVCDFKIYDQNLISILRPTRDQYRHAHAE